MQVNNNTAAREIFDLSNLLKSPETHIEGRKLNTNTHIFKYEKSIFNTNILQASWRPESWRGGEIARAWLLYRRFVISSNVVNFLKITCLKDQINLLQIVTTEMLYYMDKMDEG